MKKKAIIILLCLTMLAVSGCKKKEEKKPEKKVDKVETVTKEPEEDKEETEPKEPEQIPANQNLLTGIPDLTKEAIGKRPAAVMVNNVNDAMPQYGVGKADIIFEIPVESDLTRFMALYADYTTVPKVCAIRSCRSYFPALSEGFDAFYINWGSDPTIKEYIASLNLDQLDGIRGDGGLFGRDQERRNAGYALEHTGFFDGTKLAAVVQSRGWRTDIEEDKKDTAFQFNGLHEQIKPEGQNCTKVKVNFGNAQAAFIYDESKKVYRKDLNGNPQIDGKTNEQLTFTNVFVLETDISIKDDIGRKNIDWHGGHAGYYISNGGMQKITWAKETEESRLRFYDESGNELKINRGKSYIALNYANQAIFE